MIRGLFASFAALTVALITTPVFAADPPAAPASTNAAGPKIQFAEAAHDFGRAQSGEQVKYTYVFTNAGDQTLEVTGVHACGCITANWTKSVEPGKTGTIPISFNSSGYNGAVSKTISVTCNDPANRRPSLQFKGTVWQAIEITPNRVALRIPAGSSNATATVRIVNHMDEPITLSAPESNNHSFSAELKTVTPGKEFEVTVSAVPPLEFGMVNGQITLKTSPTNVPPVSFQVSANAMPAVTVFPTRIGMPSGPLPAATMKNVTIINNGPNVLELSDAAVNIGGVDVQLKQIEAGHRFSATLTFPQGFEVPAGKNVEFTVKANQPNVPLIKVPIVQTPAAARHVPVPMRAPPGSPTAAASAPASSNQ